MIQKFGHIWVYIAGPYTQGDVAQNVRNAMVAADQIVEMGAVPYIAHLGHFWHMFTPRPYDWWLWYDMQFLRACDVLLRLPGPSDGADGEVDEAMRRGIPVANSMDELKRIILSEQWRRRST